MPDTDIAQAMAHLQPGVQVAHFELLRPLGQGAMGVVFQARDLVLDRSVAIKFIYLDGPHLQRPGVLAAVRDRFQREARLMARVQHPSVVAIHEADLDRAEPYIVMEYLDGQLLQDRLTCTPKLTPLQVAEIGLQTAKALQAAWSLHRLIHRDLKPGNIMILADGTVKILDLGLAKALLDEDSKHHLTVTGMIMGTPPYMSPEQHMGAKTVDVRTDIFALGTILFQLLSGALPASGTNEFALYQSKSDGPSDALRQIAGLPTTLVELVYAMLAPDIDQRIHDYARIIHDLEATVDQLRHADSHSPLLGVSGVFTTRTTHPPLQRPRPVAAPTILPGGTILPRDDRP